MMVKLLIYGYATGVFSSHKLEADMAFRVLAAGNFPRYRTLCEFRRRHLEDFKALFEVLLGLISRIKDQPVPPTLTAPGFYGADS